MKKVLLSALRAEHGASCAVRRRRVAWRRRLMLVVALISTSWALGAFAHFEAVHEGAKMAADGVVAWLVEKFFSIE